MERLDKRLSATGQWSRKEARDLIRAGRVSVRGQVCQDPQQKVEQTTQVCVDACPIAAHTPVYLMLHKPAGVVCATQDARDSTVMDLLPPIYAAMGVFPVGRLDKDTEGLLLLTNDGPLAHRLLAPKHHVDKVYYLRVEGQLRQEDVEAVRQGIRLKDGYQCLPGELELLDGGTAAYITICEGKYHQVKRMMAARKTPVTYLKRIKFGPLELEAGLERAGWRVLTEGEICSLFRQ